MSDVLELNSVKDTTLWKQLDSGYTTPPEKGVAAELASITATLCNQAADRIKAFPYFHPQFTLHDQKHLLRVCELMARVVGSGLNSLNPIEVSLLILSAHFHDQGMVPDAADWARIQESADFKLSWRRWEVEHPSIRELRHETGDSRFAETEKNRIQDKLHQMQEAHRTDFLRETHGERADEIVNQLIGASGKLTITGTNLAPMLGRLCASHVWPADRLTDQNGFRLDHSIGNTTINLRFLALVLRLADILDFDRDRTPPVLLKTIHFSSTVSLLEWSKHLSVEGWDISSKRIRFTMQCEHPAYQRAAYEFMDAIDRELVQSHRIVQEFSRGTPQHYRLDLPVRVDRERIEPKNDSYRYADLEFSLSRDEIVKLLMTDKLYKSNSLFIRELLQNALDALRYRKAVYGKGAPDWNGGSVIMEHFVADSGHQVVRCIDDGIGMDEDIIRRFLTNAGRSYYRSPEFELQRVGFRDNGVDFDPCAQFGIGFMSCFMFGDQITIRTRRDYGPERGYGDPLEVEIHGLGGLLIIRDGSYDQPVGTTVEIVGPHKPAFVDDWADSVRLCGVVSGYALAVEYPIVARVKIDEIRKEVTIPRTIATRSTFLEDAGISAIRIIEQDLNEVDSRLSGSIRVAVLITDDQTPTTGNAEARWAFKAKAAGQGHQLVLETSDKTHEFHGTFEDSTTCIDGILICGAPGRGKRDHRLGHWSNHLGLGDPFLVDIRGGIKPTITPARTPPERHGLTGDPSWIPIQSLLEYAHAMAWEQVAQHLGSALDDLTFWNLTLLHDVPIHRLNAELLWHKVAVPAVASDGAMSWVRLSGIGHLTVCADGEKNQRQVYLAMCDGPGIRFTDDLRAWHPAGHGTPDWKLRALLMRFARMRIEGGDATITLRAPDSASVPEFDYGLRDRFEHRWSIPFDADASDLLAVESELEIVNRLHPVVSLVKSFADVEYEDLDDMQRFCTSVVWLLSDRENLKAIAASPISKGRQFRRLGIMFRTLDWSRYEAKYAPPYKVWTQKSGVIEVRQDHFLKWAELAQEPTGN